MAAILRVRLQSPRLPQQRRSSGCGKLFVGYVIKAVDSGAVAVVRALLGVLQR